MEDWRERLKAEYVQTKERYEKLKAHNTRRDVARHIEPCCMVDAKEREIRNYRDELTKRQQGIMGEYLHVLELRATLENIELQINAIGDIEDGTKAEPEEEIAFPTVGDADIL